jgi:hypothetical protein
MNDFIRWNKAKIREFLVHYSDERLCALLAHAQSGKLAYYSCCCFIGACNSDHALRGLVDHPSAGHYIKAKGLPGASVAEMAFYRLPLNQLLPLNEEGLGIASCSRKYDPARRARLIPILKAELKRRELRVARFSPEVVRERVCA